ncbi:MAG TPA: carboxypeptidase regulatory-like domain-containing protein [Asanoa sp.]|nr:carboxypeptidase regulatory-like domain-containing protein [Asanoa sp.]
MRSIVRRRATAAVAAAVMAGTMAVWATPAQAAATGVISGHVTTAAGAPAGDILVQALDSESLEGRGFTTTATDGSYRIDGLATGQYIVGFNGDDYAEQYFDGKVRISEADPVTVTDGHTTTVDEDLLAAGYLTGRFTDPTGAPLESSLVRVYRAEDDLVVRSAGTQSDGTFRISIPAGTYYVTFEPVQDLYQEQYVPGKLTGAAAQRFVVTADHETTVNDTALAPGSLSGRVTRSDGTPARDITIYAAPFKGFGGESATTDSNGEFSVPRLLAGDYGLEFWVGNRTEYFDRTSDPDQADPVTVIGGRDNRITPSLLPTGSVRVRALDAVTGAVIRDFCANSQCSDGSSKVLLTDLAEGTQPLDIWAEGNYISRDSNVTVRADQTIDVVVRLLPGAKITTTVIDKATGRALPNVCLFAYKPGQIYYPQGIGDDQCSDSAGKVTLSKLEAGDYRIFAEPRNKSYGRQWVTANGGSGDERQAVTIKATTGKTATAPQVRIDRAGSIRGLLTDAATGAPINFAGVGVFTESPGSGGGETTTDEDGRFQLDGLGPYRWPVSYNGGERYAPGWTGGAVSRYAATGIQVTAGAVATADFALTTGVTVLGNVLTSHGTPQWGRITVQNTETGDYAGTVDFAGTGYELHVLPGQELRYTYHLDIDGKSFSSYKVKLAPATPGGPPRYSVTIPAGGLTVDVLAD